MLYLALCKVQALHCKGLSGPLVETMLSPPDCKIDDVIENAKSDHEIERKPKRLLVMTKVK